MTIFSTTAFDEWEESFRARYHQHKAAGTEFIYDFGVYFPGRDIKSIKIFDLDKDKKGKSVPGSIIAREIPVEAVGAEKPRPSQRDTTFTELRQQFEWFCKDDILPSAYKAKVNALYKDKFKDEKYTIRGWEEIKRVLFAEYLTHLSADPQP